MKSSSAKDLAVALGVKRIKREKSTFKGGPHTTVINWGSSSMDIPVVVGRVLNFSEYVNVASNKLSALRKMSEYGVTIPNFCTLDQGNYYRWLNIGTTVIGRKILNGHSGEGIVIFEPDEDYNDEDFDQCQLFTQYIPKKEEWRIHCMKDEDGVTQVIGVQRKGLSPEFKDREDINWKVRNLSNGFIYVRNDGRVPPDLVLDSAKLSVSALSLDFGAVDVIWNEKQQRAYVLEVNTAPGLTGTTITEYVEAFRRVI